MNDKFLRLKLRLASLIPSYYMATECGHRTRRTGKIRAFGQTLIVRMPINEDGSVDYCLDCIGKMTIPCAWCCEPIFIGEPITLYSPYSRRNFFSSEESSEAQKKRGGNGSFIIPDGAVVYSHDPLYLVGCLKWNCADTGADIAGCWLPGKNGKGRVQRLDLNDITFF